MGDLAALERRLLLVGPETFLADERRPSGSAPADETAFALGRARKQAEDFVRARRLLAHAAESADRTLRARADAHLAHLDYYDGHFAAGLARARALAAQTRGLARAEAALYASVNAIALNDARLALRLALDAKHVSQRVADPVLRQDVRFRAARQLVHVLVASGDLIGAAAEAAAAEGIARRIGTARLRGYAAYLRGYVRYARGERAALADFAEAASHWGARYRAFGRWSQYLWACALRDHGEVEAARSLRDGSGVDLPWERPLFDIAEGRPPRAPALSGVPADELPFRAAASGVVALLGGDPGRARAHLASATAEFARCGLEHQRRGAALNLVVALEASGRHAEAGRLLAVETAALTRHEVVRWPWWTPPVAARLAELGAARNGRGYWALLHDSLRRSTVAVAEALRSQELTEREIAVVTTWLEHRDWPRRRVAAALGISEASARNHLNHARRKLLCGTRRGPEALAARLRAVQQRSRHAW